MPLPNVGPNLWHDLELAVGGLLWCSLGQATWGLLFSAMGGLASWGLLWHGTGLGLADWVLLQGWLIRVLVVV